MPKLVKLAMGLNASKGKKTAIDKIYPRHFFITDRFSGERGDGS